MHKLDDLQVRFDPGLLVDRMLRPRPWSTKERKDRRRVLQGLTAPLIPPPIGADMKRYNGNLSTARHRSEAATHEDVPRKVPVHLCIYDGYQPGLTETPRITYQCYQ